jgi:hypothetical protein
MSTRMEQFFTPSRHLQDRVERTRMDDEYTEVQLTVSVEEFLRRCRWGWNDLRAFLIGGATPKLLWITENAFLVVDDEDFGDDIAHAIFRELNGQEQALILVHLHDTLELSTGEAGIFWRAITTSNSVHMTIENYYGFGNRLALPSGPILSSFLRESPSLQVLELKGFDFKEEHCRALATLPVQVTNLKINFSDCSFQPQDAEDTFIEWFRNTQVVTGVQGCPMGSRMISALSGNHSVKKLTLGHYFGGTCVGEDEMGSLAQSLPGNIGIQHLTILYYGMSEKTWIILFRSLSTHPRITRLSLPTTSSMRFDHTPHLSAASKEVRMKAIIQMLQINTVVLTIDLADQFDDEELYQKFILPRLEMNRSCFEVQRQDVKRADPSIRPQLLGRALHAVQYNPELVFRFLSENVPAFVRSEE